MSTIYHVTTKQEWEAAQAKGYYEASSLATEGFIHCSKAGQVSGVLERYFSDREGLVKLTIDPNELQHPLRYEWAPSVGEEFPHIYGPLNLDAVTEVEQVSGG